MKADGSNNDNRGTVATRARSKGLKDLVGTESVKERFREVLGDRAPSFLASVLNAVRLNPMLGDCDPVAVLSCAMAAASFDLPIDANLGLSAIVPYRKKGGEMVPQFQIMYKGYIQLALRSGQYKTMHVGPIYADELKGYNIITGDVDIEPVEDGYRAQERDDMIAGYVAFFRLLNGFEKTEFWSMKRILAHGKRYSKSFDKEYGLWKTDLPAMARKTVLKNTISQWGALSVTMQKAMIADQATIRDFDRPLDEANVEYVDTFKPGERPEEPPASADSVNPAPATSPPAKPDTEPMAEPEEGPDLF